MESLLNLVVYSIQQVWLSLQHNWPFLVVSVVIAAALKFGQARLCPPTVDQLASAAAFSLGAHGMILGEAYKVDGFRFDLAATLARELHEVDRLGAFLDIIHQDPILSQVKLIAEPWDLGEGGYQVGNFPVLWAEWNGQYRDTVRAYWKGDEGQAGPLAYRLTGSSDIYGRGGRRPYASINFVTAHDGFTLHDLVSYDRKHNEANGEENRDGESHNRSWNCGAEGPSTDAEVLGLRRRQERNFLTTLLLSQGVPMLLHGDELGRSQAGNNNAYCQDNEIAWVDWDLDEDRAALLEFTSSLVHLRRDHPVLRRRRFFAGSAEHGGAGSARSWAGASGGGRPRWSPWRRRARR